MTGTVYTKDVVADIVARYKAVVDKDYDARSEVVAELAAELKVAVASVRSKLSREGVYVAKETVTIASKGMSKDEYVKAFEAVSGETLTSFTKATRKDLATFWEYIVKASDKADADAK